jgi:epoxyqueuosine reductase QueG
MVSPEIRALFETDPVRAVDRVIKEFVSTSPVNRLPPEGEMPIFDEPLVRFAAGDDPLYTEYKSIIDPTHLTPQEAVAQALDREPEGLPALSVVSWVLPITEDTRASNRKEKTMPSRRWSYTRWYGEKFNDALRQRMVDVLTDVGAAAVSPVLQPYFTQTSSEKTGLFSVWSERHTAYAAGHGTFSLSDGFITDKGIAHRCGSVITDLPLPASGRAATDHLSNCTFYADGTCKVCIQRCPAGAITEQGHSKSRCREYMRQEIGHLLEEYQVGVAGCGLCQTKVPCEYRVPAKVLKLRKRAGRG